MAIQIDNYVQKCKEKIDRKSIQVTGTLGVRIPNRPVVVTFLGSHDEEGIRRFYKTLEQGWPTFYHRIVDQIQTYFNSNLFRSAIKTEDADGATAIDRCILSATNSSELTSSNALMVYFLNFNDAESLKMLDLLNLPYTTPVGGQKSRIIFAIGKTTTNRGMKQSLDFIEKIREYARSNDNSVWKNTSCVMLSDYQYGGMTLRHTEYLDNYVLAMNILLMEYSVRQHEDSFTPVKLPCVTDSENPVLTATLCRECKPSEQIARTLIFEYLRYGIALTKRPNNEDVSNVSLREVSSNAIKELFGKLYDNGTFPKAKSLVHFPFSASCGSDVGISGGNDKTFGIWNSFCQANYINPIYQVYGDAEALKEYFENYFSVKCGYSCGVIQRTFPAFMNELDESTEADFNPQIAPSPSDSLEEWGLYIAKKTITQLAFPALKEAVSEFGNVAGKYTNMLAALSGQVTPSEQSVKTYYSNLVDIHMGKRVGEYTVEDVLSRPCSEEQFMSRLDMFIESITNQEQLRMNFFDELKSRLADDGADTMISAFLNMPMHKLTDRARMNNGYLNSICEASLFDSSLMGNSTKNLFVLCGTNSMDRVVIFDYKPS